MATKENKREYIISNRIMTVVILCFAVLLALIFISRGYNLIVDTRQATVFLVNSLVISVPSVLLAGALLYFFNQRRKKEKKDRVFSANFVLSLAVLLFILGLGIRLEFTRALAIDAAFILVPVLGALYIVYYSFQRECFTLAVAIATGGVLLYLLYKVINYTALATLGLPLCILLAVLMLLYGVLMFRVSKAGGTLKLGGRKVKFAEPNGRYLPCYLYAVVGALSFLAVGIFGRLAAYYAVFVSAGCAILAGLYYLILQAQKTRK